MILTGNQIFAELGKRIDIQPFSLRQLNPNSYNLKLADELLVYEDGVLDMKAKNPYKIITIPKDGLKIVPGNLYLGRTVEKTSTKDLVPMLEGRSSVGRLGISIHETAGFGDIGFNGYWTLEISCIRPVIIYPGVEICQIYYHTIYEDENLECYCKINKTYSNGKYQNNWGIQPSMMWKDFEKSQNSQFF